MTNKENSTMIVCECANCRNFRTCETITRNSQLSAEVDRLLEVCNDLHSDSDRVSLVAKIKQDATQIVGLVHELADMKKERDEARAELELQKYYFEKEKIAFERADAAVKRAWVKLEKIAEYINSEFQSPERGNSLSSDILLMIANGKE